MNRAATALSYQTLIQPLRSVTSSCRGIPDLVSHGISAELTKGRRTTVRTRFIEAFRETVGTLANSHRDERKASVEQQTDLLRLNVTATAVLAGETQNKLTCT